jgi:hypothetical protein
LSERLSKEISSPLSAAEFQRLVGEECAQIGVQLGSTNTV